MTNTEWRIACEKADIAIAERQDNRLIEEAPPMAYNEEANGGRWWEK